MNHLEPWIVYLAERLTAIEKKIGEIVPDANASKERVTAERMAGVEASVAANPVIYGNNPWIRTTDECGAQLCGAASAEAVVATRLEFLQRDLANTREIVAKMQSIVDAEKQAQSQEK